MRSRAQPPRTADYPSRADRDRRSYRGNAAPSVPIAPRSGKTASSIQLPFGSSNRIGSCLANPFIRSSTSPRELCNFSEFCRLGSRAVIASRSLAGREGATPSCARRHAEAAQPMRGPPQPAVAAHPPPPRLPEARTTGAPATAGRRQTCGGDAQDTAIPQRQCDTVAPRAVLDHVESHDREKTALHQRSRASHLHRTRRRML